jgi:hypothetical protein
MVEDDSTPFRELLQTVAENYDVTLSPARILMFFGALREYELDIVRAAFDRFMKSPESRYKFPVPVQIIETIEGTQNERDAILWETLSEAIRRVGPWVSIVCADHAFAAAIRAVWGSWPECAEAKIGNNEFVWMKYKSEFLTAYRVHKRRQPTGEPAMLIGHNDQSARDNSFFPKRNYVGLIQANGTVALNRVDIDNRTGLPAASLPEVLALTAAVEAPKLLPEHREIGDEKPPYPPEETFRRMTALAKQLADGHAISEGAIPVRSAGPATPEGQEKEENGQRDSDDRTPNTGTRATGSDSGIRVCRNIGPEVESGLRVDRAMADSVRAGRRRFRERDLSGAGSVDHAPGKDQRGMGQVPSGSRTGKGDSSRRRPQHRAGRRKGH